MSDAPIPPNELADLYEAFFTLLENIPDESHPGWRFAIESILFGGDGIVEEASGYGEQQAERNDFKITDYREQYGDGERVSVFHSIDTEFVTPNDDPHLNESVELPVAPESDQVLPLYVSNEELNGAISLLNEFPAEPRAVRAGQGNKQLLNPKRFPGLKPPEQTTWTRDTGGAPSEIPPNELAELYEVFRRLLNQLPETVHPVWAEAIEAMVFGGDCLHSDRQPFGPQQAERNTFMMNDYRAVYGDGERVTEFSYVDTIPGSSSSNTESPPLVPDTDQPLPLDPNHTELREALLMLERFPAAPAAESGSRIEGPLLNTPRLFKKAGLDATPDAEPATTSVAGGTESADDSEADSSLEVTDPSLSAEQPASESTETLRSEDVGEVAESPPSSTETSEPSYKYEVQSSSAKYDDPRAQRAHERAQRRHPSKIVELGEEIELVLQEVDYSYTDPTIMGRKNKLVIFVEDAPQGLSKHDKIRAKVVDYGGNNNCAHAVFLDYSH